MTFETRTDAAQHKVEATPFHAELHRQSNESGLLKVQGTTASSAGMDKFPSAQDLLGELSKDAKIAGSTAKGWDKNTLDMNVHQLENQLKHMSPEDMKLVAEMAKQIKDAQAAGKPLDINAKLDEIAKMYKGKDGHPSDKAMAIWNAAVLERAREDHKTPELIKHADYSYQKGNAPDPTPEHVLLSPKN